VSITSAQCRAARALIGWSQDQLASASKVAKATIANFEAGKREPYPRTRDDLKGALESMGIELTNGNNPGVRVKCPIVFAMKTLASYVLKNIDMSVSSGSDPTLPNAEVRASRKQKVVDICSEIDALADASRVRQIRFADFEKLRQELQKLNVFATNEQVSAVAHAFQTTEC
jgi:transcriptional regulator with XRE-family HTH domain